MKGKGQLGMSSLVACRFSAVKWGHQAKIKIRYCYESSDSIVLLQNQRLKNPTADLANYALLPQELEHGNHAQPVWF